MRLTWTAPGDDGGRGTATVYQIKWADLPMVEIASDPKHVNFWAAERVTGEPAPRPAGSRETFAVKGLRAGTYYFALKSRDEINNESAISNVVGVEVK